MKTKICSKCKQEKPLSDFHKDRLRKCGYRCQCKDCIKKWQKENRIKLHSYLRQNRRSFKQKYVDYKGGKCSICGYNKCTSALEFHHINPQEKELSFRNTIRDWVKAKKELDKCICVCANCHRELHYYLEGK